MQPSQQLHDVGEVGLGFALDKLAPEHTNDGCALQKRQVERQFGNLAARKPHHAIPPAPVDAAKRGFGVDATNRIVNHVWRNIHGFQRLAQVLDGVIDGVIRAVRTAHLEFLIARGCRDHTRTHGLANFDGGQAHTTRRAQYQHGFPGFQLPSVNHRVVRRAIRHCEGRRDLEIHAGWQRQHHALWHARLRCERAMNGDRHDGIAGFEARYALPNGSHHARQLRPWRERQFGFELVLALHDQHVREVHPGGFDVNHDLTGLWFKVGKVFNDQ